MSENSVYGFPVGTNLTLEQIRAVQVAMEKAQAKLPAKPKPKPQGETK